VEVDERGEGRCVDSVFGLSDGFNIGRY